MKDYGRKLADINQRQQKLDDHKVERLFIDEVIVQMSDMIILAFGLAVLTAFFILGAAAIVNILLAAL